MRNSHALKRKEGIIGKNVLDYVFFFSKGTSSLSREPQGNQEVRENSLACTTLQPLLQAYPILVCLIIHKNRASTSPRDFIQKLLDSWLDAASVPLFSSSTRAGLWEPRKWAQLLTVMLKSAKEPRKTVLTLSGRLPANGPEQSFLGLFVPQGVYTTGFSSGVMTV